MCSELAGRAGQVCQRLWTWRPSRSVPTAGSCFHRCRARDVRVLRVHHDAAHVVRRVASKSAKLIPRFSVFHTPPRRRRRTRCWDFRVDGDVPTRLVGIAEQRPQRVGPRARPAVLSSTAKSATAVLPKVVSSCLLISKTLHALSGRRHSTACSTRSAHALLPSRHRPSASD
jgi:hypothetical protein